MTSAVISLNITPHPTLGGAKEGDYSPGNRMLDKVAVPRDLWLS